MNNYNAIIELLGVVLIIYHSDVTEKGRYIASQK